MDVGVPHTHDPSELELRRWDDTVVLQHASNVQGMNDGETAAETEEECWEGSHLCRSNQSSRDKLPDSLDNSTRPQREK